MEKQAAPSFLKSFFLRKKEMLCGFTHRGKLYFPSCSVVFPGLCSEVHFLKHQGLELNQGSPKAPCSQYRELRGSYSEVTLTYFRHLL